MRSANLAVRLLLELASLLALGYWGWVTAEALPLRVLLAVAGPTLFATVWGLLISPKAPRRLPDPVRLLVEIVLFSFVTAALVAAGTLAVAVVFAGAVAAHLALMVRWAQRGM